MNESNQLLLWVGREVVALLLVTAFAYPLHELSKLLWTKMTPSRLRPADKLLFQMRVTLLGICAVTIFMFMLIYLNL